MLIYFLKRQESKVSVKAGHGVWSSSSVELEVNWPPSKFKQVAFELALPDMGHVNDSPQLLVWSPRIKVYTKKKIGLLPGCFKRKEIWTLTIIITIQSRVLSFGLLKSYGYR